MAKKKKRASIVLMPLMSRKYSASERKRLREYEQYLIRLLGKEHQAETTGMKGEEFFHQQATDGTYQK